MLGMLVGLTLFSSPTNAQTVPSAEQIERAYSNDPLGLIAYREETSAYSISIPDRIEVYICHTNGPNEPDPKLLKNQLDQASLYFRWLSGGLYDPKIVLSDTVISSTEVGNCSEDVEAFISSRSNSKEITGVVIMTDTNLVINPSSQSETWGWGWNGVRCVTRSDLSCNYLDTEREAQINSNTSPNGTGHQSTNTLVHELGHMLAFPHSFSGEQVSEYDNDMDIMSGGQESIKFGTLAINRYAAGWIDRDQVAEYSVSESDSRIGRTLRLMPLGQPGLQMLVLPVQPVQPGKFYALGARVASRFDDDIPKEGVEVYLIDQSKCSRGVCPGIQRRTKPVVAANSSVDQLGHVYTEGQVIVMDDTRGVRVRVLEPKTADESGFWVWVGPGPLPEGSFHDDEGLGHEIRMSIDWLATTGITQGCDRKDPYRFCPSKKVTRAQMVTFLGRALGLTATTGDRTFTANFNDVNPGSEYAGYLDPLGSIASGYPDGTFRPNQPITRGEMAVMLNRALKLDADQGRDTVAFTDVPPGTELATAAANLYAAEITKGCRNYSGSEPLFCPDDSLTRAQMAAFFYRSQDFLDLSDGNDGSSADREVRIEWGDDLSHYPDPRIRSGCDDFVFCRAFDYKLIGDFGPGPYTLECWIGGKRWPPITLLNGQEVCRARGNSLIRAYAVVDGVRSSNELHWKRGDDVGREVRISVGEPSTRCPRNENCWGLHRDYDYKLNGLGPGPYTLECWARMSGGEWDRLHTYNSWPGPGSSAEGCYSWGESGGQTVYVVVDGVRSNELDWTLSDDASREVRIEWGDDMSHDPKCDDFVFCRAFDYKLIGDFGPGPYTLECWIGGKRWPPITLLNGQEVCRARGNSLIRAYAVVDGVRSSNELHWTRRDDAGREVRMVRIEWGDDLSHYPDPRIRSACDDFVFCRAFDYKLIGDFGPGPYTLECGIGGKRWPTITLLNGKEVCRARGNSLIRAYAVVDGVRSSNELHWKRLR